MPLCGQPYCFPIAGIAFAPTVFASFFLRKRFVLFVENRLQRAILSATLPSTKSLTFSKSNEVLCLSFLDLCSQRPIFRLWKTPPLKLLLKARLLRASNEPVLQLSAPALRIPRVIPILCCRCASLRPFSREMPDKKSSPNLPLFECPLCGNYFSESTIEVLYQSWPQAQAHASSCSGSHPKKASKPFAGFAASEKIVSRAVFLLL